MRRDYKVPMFAIAGALLGLILLLATLQYKWLGQISGAERERMTANLNTRAAAFGVDFDRELTRAYLLFQLDPMQQDQSAAAGIVTRYDRWQATARFPRMIKDVFVVPSSAAVNESGLLQRFNPSTRFLEPTDWPASLSEIRKRLSSPEPSGTAGAGAVIMRSMVPTVWPDVPALVVAAPIVMLGHLDGRAGGAEPSLSMTPDARYTLLLLDADYIRRELLPALAQQHFQGTGDGFDYKVAVVPTAGTSKGLVYHSIPDFLPGPDAAADARVELFQVRVKDFEPLVNEVSRFATFTAAMPQHRPTTGNRTFINQTMTAPGANVSIRTAPMSIVVQSTNGNSAAIQQRVERLISGAATYTASSRATVPPPHWRLLVTHPAGSLEQAVNAVRRRNLLISTSILGILGVSVGFLVLSTRRAQDLARQQLEFVATVSHELRTPLAVIRSAADNLADGVVNDEARVRQYGQLVRREGLRLTDLVEQILEFAGLQSGQRTMTTRPVEVSGMLRDVVAATEAIALAAGVAIELDLADHLPAVAGDEAALRRVFQNLVSNALKYGAGGGWVGVRSAVSGGQVDVSVTDRGIGIAATDQEKIFDPFYRTPDVVAAQIQGAGLGLSLVKRIVEAHAGRVTLKSAPGEGSTFTVSLPILQGDVAERHDGVTQPAAQPL
jgi:two-component system, OmpR family, sensor histidine kinase SenX3